MQIADSTQPPPLRRRGSLGGGMRNLRTGYLISLAQAVAQIGGRTLLQQRTAH
jgi:hypothetical protein